jgi:hypothetical protein
MGKQDEVRKGAAVVFGRMIHRAAGVPESLREVKLMAECAYRVGLVPLCDDPRFEAKLRVDQRGDAVIFYNAQALPSLQMLYIWHEIAEFATIEDNPSLFDFEEGFTLNFSGGWDPRDLRHRIAIETETLYMAALRNKGHSTRVMERRHRRKPAEREFNSPVETIRRASFTPPVTTIDIFVLMAEAEQKGYPHER